MNIGCELTAYGSNSRQHKYSIANYYFRRYRIALFGADNIVLKAGLFSHDIYLSYSLILHFK